jgi:phospholipid/cholesterol/gamma-HCH transport system substrate-binding protein
VKRKSIAPPLIKGLVFTLVTVLATAVLGITIANTSVGDTVSYNARFTDVTGLNTGDDVRIAGVQVGQVQKISVVDGHFARVRFSVESGRRLPTSVTATIKYRNLVGQRYIALERGTGPVDEVLSPGDEIPLEQTRPALDLTELFNGFQPLFRALSPKDVNQLAGEIVQVLQGEDTTLDSLVAHTASLASTLADRDRVIGQVIDNLNAVLSTVNSRGNELADMVTTLQRLVSGLAQDRKPIGDAVQAMASLTDTTAGLLEVGRAPLKQDIAALGRVSATLADNTPTVDTFLRRLPVKMERIATLASYGSWLNFYLCSATVTGVQVDTGGGPPVPPPTGLPVTDSRCR